VARISGGRDRVAASLSSGETVRAGTASQFASVLGVLENTPNVFTRQLSLGSYLTRSDVDTARRVAVLGYGVAQRLFGDRDPVGLQMDVAGVRFRVIGVFAKLGQSLGVDRDDEVHIPLTAAQRLIGTSRVDGLAIKAPDPATVDQLGGQIVAELTHRHPGTEFSAVTQEQILGVLGEILGVLTGVLAAIAGISLLVGGVGVSNIMLVSVRERTREIGLRKAMGARQRDILLQFLIEAVLLCVVGGVIGIGIGVGTSLLVDTFSPLPAVIAWWSPALAFAVSAAVGIFFGVAPARRAGRLDPVVALRTE
jgi:putative ABC transport system permease protein